MNAQYTYHLLQVGFSPVLRRCWSAASSLLTSWRSVDEGCPFF